MSKRSLAAAALLAGLLAAAAPAHAGTLVGNPGKEKGVVESVSVKYTMFMEFDAAKSDVSIETTD
jgi:hypothetical protein